MKLFSHVLGQIDGNKMITTDRQASRFFLHSHPDKADAKIRRWAVLERNLLANARNIYINPGQNFSCVNGWTNTRKHCLLALEIKWAASKFREAPESKPVNWLQNKHLSTLSFSFFFFSVMRSQRVIWEQTHRESLSCSVQSFNFTMNAAP